MSIQFMPSGALLSGLGAFNVDNSYGLQRLFGLGLVSCVLLNGRNTAVGATLSDIWGYPYVSPSQPVRTLPSSGYTMAVISDSTLDVYGTGTGAWVVGINYLDTSYNQNTALFALNGQTAVTTALSINGGAGGTVTNAIRQNGMEVVAAGTGSASVGNIYACDSTNTYTAGVPQTTTKVFDMVIAGDNIDSSSQYTIPANFNGAVLSFLPAICSTTTTSLYGRVRVGMTTGSNGIYRYFDLGGISSNNNPVPIVLPFFPIATAQSDLKIQASASATTEVSCVNFLMIWPTNK